MEIVINKIEELLCELSKLGNKPIMFRGQSRDWELLPSIARYPEIAQGCQDWATLQDWLLEEFMRLGAPYFITEPKDEIEKLVIAQHHGLPTRLLDTANNPLKALHFAVGNPSEDKYDGVLWAFQYRSWHRHFLNEYKKSWGTKLSPLLPAQMHPRLTAQEGTFICYPLPEDSEPLLPIEKMNDHDITLVKFIIESKSKPLIRKEIKVLGARHSLLFPDLDGVAKEITLTLL